MEQKNTVITVNVRHCLGEKQGFVEVEVWPVLGHKSTNLYSSRYDQESSHNFQNAAGKFLLFISVKPWSIFKFHFYECLVASTAQIWL